ncbi:MAG: cob(I)yrinic acid a,c-diamide adenosyltransferase [Gammaproteobacteria bacterium]|nr:cob(I)yrinic acid a,c-diamide adenosyltransferase [Gammaproteobacteria bacterium]
MGNRLSKIYTRTGDDGTTSIGDKNRILKNHPRLEVLGTIDELNSAIGVILAQKPSTTSINICLEAIQQELFNLGGELCPPYYTVITAEKIEHLEKQLDEWNNTLPPLKEFIMPGGNLKSASCHLARTICRRAERACVTLLQSEPFNTEILRYLNRLSDLLFVAARLLAKESQSEETLWKHERK